MATTADNPGQFKTPQGIAVAADGTLYVADTGNHRIRKITPAGFMTTLAGGGACGSADGTGGAAQFCGPTGVAMGVDGTLYVADTGSHKIRKITPAGVVTTLAGSDEGSADGLGGAAQFAYPAGIAVAADDTDTTVVAGISYTYTVTANGPGTVSNIIGPFVP